MNGIAKVLSALLLLVTAATAEAAAPRQLNVGLRDVIDTVEKSYRALDDVTADFFQRSTIVEKDKQREMRATGQMFVKPPNANFMSPLKFRFDFFRPTTQEIVCNGKTLWVYLPENRQVIESDVSFFFNVNFNPDRDQGINFLQGLGRFSKDFQVVFTSQRQDINGNYVLECQPYRSMASIRKLFMVVNRDAVFRYVQANRDIGPVISDPTRPDLAFPVLSTTVEDHQGNTTVIEFSNVHPNNRLSDALFEFVVPANVQVVRPPTGAPSGPTVR